MKPLISVIIVNYNAGEALAHAVTSALKLKDSETILVDNHSSDASLAPLPKSPTLKVIKNKRNLGFAKAVNMAVTHARGKYLLLLNPDATLTQGSLDLMSAELARRGGRAVIAPALFNPDGSPQPSCYRRQTPFSALKEFWLGQSGAYRKYLPNQHEPSVVDVAVAATWLLPRSLYQELGGLSEEYFLYFEDLDFCDRARAAKIPVVYLPSARSTHHHGISAGTNPNTASLFLTSARQYHGLLNKTLIDLIIRSGSLLRGTATLKKSLFLWGLSFLAVFTFSLLAYFLLPSRAQPSLLISSPFDQNFLWWGFANFDGEHYLSIAQNGYQSYKGQSQHAFFPLLPLLIAGLSNLGLNLYLAGRFVTLSASLATVFVLSQWLRIYFHNSLSALWLFFLGTGSIFLYSLYTEPLFLLFVASTFLFSERKQWGLAVLFAVLATATRVTGVFLFPYLFLMLTRAHFSALRAFTISSLSLTGLASYMTYLALTVGNPLAFFSAQADWGKANPTSPVTTLINYFTALTTEFSFDLTHLVVWIEVLVTLSLWYLLYLTIRKKLYPPAYLVYCFGNLAMPLLTGSLGSMPRFALASFPLLAVIPTLPPPSRRLLSFLMLLAGMIGTILFIRGYWYA